ncbi:hypothetical protein D3C75_1001570 [compost metagenome]
MTMDTSWSGWIRLRTRLTGLLPMRRNNQNPVFEVHNVDCQACIGAYFIAYSMEGQCLVIAKDPAPEGTGSLCISDKET